MPKSVLIVDDESRIRRMIAGYLREYGYIILEASDGKEALEIMNNRSVDLVILDLMMPRLDGESFLKQVRVQSNVYIIILTAKTGEDSQVHGYAIGADDFVEKPFSCKALASKVAAVFTRLDQKLYGMAITQVKGIVLDDASRAMSVNDEKMDLKPKEFDLISYLMLNRNIALSREQILNDVWGADYDGSDRTVDIHISNLRKKLGDNQGLIQTLSGFGYKFEVLK
jgi:two-component system response regulator ResD